MSRIAWHRPARIPPSALPAERLTIPAPPQITTQSSNAMWITLLLPMLSSFTMAGYMIAYQRRTLMYMAMGIVILSIGITAAVRYQMRATVNRSKARQRQRYIDHLAQVRDSARAVAAAQRTTANWQYPSPERLLGIAGQPRRVWERRRDDEDFLRLRVGTGRGPLAVPLALATRIDPTIEYDPALMASAHRVIEMCGTVGRQPAYVELASAGVLSIVGPAEQGRATCRALLCQAAALHAPDDVTIMVCTSGNDAAWAWTTWLPHARDPEVADASAAAPLVASDYLGLADALERELTRAADERAQRRGRLSLARTGRPSRRVIVVVDSFDPASPWGRSPLARKLVELAGGDLGISLVTLVQQEPDEPSRVDVRIQTSDGELRLVARDPGLIGPVTSGAADQPPIPLCEAIAREVAPLQLTESHEEALTRDVSLSDLLGFADPSVYDPSSHWIGPGDERVLCAPIGVTGAGEEVVLDLKEAAQAGMGPHGLVVGATGSGKSELLRTLLSGLTASHPPDLLSLVLVDFKGGATFAGMTELPHVAGLITNLADDLALVDRVHDALMGEQQRRQRLLRAAGNVDSLRDYQTRQAAGGLDVNGRPLEPLPYLLVIVDEFGELLSARPDFINLFVQIGRVGRSLGIHLLLATQRLEEGRLRGLESHLSYRICLRTFTAMESRAVIGTPDAYRLPSLPGSAYLKVDESLYERFRVAHVSGAYQDPETVVTDEESAEVMPLVLREPPDPVADRSPEPAARPVTPSVPGPTQLQVLVARLRQYGQPVHQVWLPPLPGAISLDMVLGPLHAPDARGLQAAMWPVCGSLRFPVGVIDLPLSQEQQPLVIDFAQFHPNLVLVGAPQSGKSTFLRTMMLSAMLTHTPDELQFCCLDYGGGTLRPFAAAPHTTGVVGRAETQRARRALAEARRLIAERELLFQQVGVSSVSEFRRLRDEGRLGPGVMAADLVVIIDNWGAARGEVADIDPVVLEIASRGPGVGVHLILTAHRWGDVRMNLRDAISARLELRLGDPSESEVSRAAARRVPAASPGRGVLAPGRMYQAMLPRVDGGVTVDGLGEAQEEVLTKITASWQGQRAAPIRVLPERISVTELGAATQPGSLIGIGERDLEPVCLDLTGDDQHCLIVGDGSSGKSTLLGTWMRGLVARHAAADVRFMVVDYRRALTGIVPAAYIGAYAGDSSSALAYAGQLAATLAGRMPPVDLSARQLKDRDWWTGPELYLVVDDYDLVASGTASPLRALADHIGQARETGFHVVVARSSGSISRALVSDPVISRVRELGAAGVLLSSDAREGVLIGGERGGPQPPGRGVLVRRRHDPELIQVAVSEDDCVATAGP